jgi:hypothetical protein
MVYNMELAILWLTHLFICVYNLSKNIMFNIDIPLLIDLSY